MSGARTIWSIRPRGSARPTSTTRVRRSHRLGHHPALNISPSSKLQLTNEWHKCITTTRFPEWSPRGYRRCSGRGISTRARCRHGDEPLLFEAGLNYQAADDDPAAPGRVLRHSDVETGGTFAGVVVPPMTDEGPPTGEPDQRIRRQGRDELRNRHAQREDRMTCSAPPRAHHPNSNFGYRTTNYVLNQVTARPPAVQSNLDYNVGPLRAGSPDDAAPDGVGRASSSRANPRAGHDARSVALSAQPRAAVVPGRAGRELAGYRSALRVLLRSVRQRQDGHQGVGQRGGAGRSQHGRVATRRSQSRRAWRARSPTATSTACPIAI